MRFSGFYLFMESIKAIQAQNIYRVNPVTLFRERQPHNTNIFSNQNNFNLNRPVAQNETVANHLDLLA